MLEPADTATAPCDGVLDDVETLHLDRGYDANPVLGTCASYGISDVVCSKKRPRGRTGARRKPKTAPLGLRWPVERTNSQLSNFGQLRRNTDRQPKHRLAQLALAIAVIITAKLIDWRNRWNPK